MSGKNKSPEQAVLDRQLSVPKLANALAYFALFDLDDIYRRKAKELNQEFLTAADVKSKTQWRSYVRSVYCAYLSAQQLDRFTPDRLAWLMQTHEGLGFSFPESVLEQRAQETVYKMERDSRESIMHVAQHSFQNAVDVLRAYMQIRPYQLSDLDRARRKIVGNLGRIIEKEEAAGTIIGKNTIPIDWRG